MVGDALLPPAKAGEAVMTSVLITVVIGTVALALIVDVVVLVGFVKKVVGVRDE